MPRNFDVIWGADSLDARTFVMGGETFVVREAVRPEVLGAELSKLDAVREADDTGFVDVINAVDEFVIAMIEPDGGGEDAAGRYRKLREVEDGGLSAGRIQQVRAWIIEKQTTEVEEQTGFPTTPPPASSRGPRRSGRSSTADSSSQGLQAV